jgi:plastocyanin
MMNRSKLLFVVVIGAAEVTGARTKAAAVAAPEAGPAGTQASGAADVARLQADVARLQGDITRLQQDARDQRQLVLNLMQSEQQRYDVLLQYLRSLGSAGAAPPSALPGFPAAQPPRAPAAASPSESPDEIRAGAGTIRGKVTLPSGADDAYVYVDGLHGSGAPRAGTVEIKQQDKQFSPHVLAVPTGTKVIFPNRDAIFHNVFSVTPGSAFDVGSVKGGDTSRPVMLTKAGHLEIFCNIHRRMRADVLVVPNGHFAKVHTDGSFELPGVPAGSRKVVLWGPGLKPASQQVEVTAKGVSLHLSAQAEAVRPHLNKVGQVYGSYDD